MHFTIVIDKKRWKVEFLQPRTCKYFLIFQNFDKERVNPSFFMRKRIFWDEKFPFLLPLKSHFDKLPPYSTKNNNTRP